MNLCNIHMHDGAEHKGGDFSKYRGNGDGKGFGTGFVYSGTLSDAELADDGLDVGAGKHAALEPGGTIEVHYVHSTAQVTPGPTLGPTTSPSLPRSVKSMASSRRLTSPVIQARLFSTPDLPPAQATMKQVLRYRLAGAYDHR